MGSKPVSRPLAAEQRTRDVSAHIARAASQSAVTLPEAPANTSSPPVVRTRPQAAELARAGSWGWFPAIALAGAVGLVLVGRAMRIALDQAPGAMLLFWFGLMTIYIPVALRMALPQTSRRERLVLAVWVGMALYLVKILRGPTGFIFHDEFPHFDTVNDIIRTSTLFQVNSLQEISAYFPGLEIVTAALVRISGLSIEPAGLIVIAAARLIASLGIYLLYEEISGSSRIAGVGSVLAIAYPNYTFWSSQYSYESLALPVAVLVLLAGLWTVRRNTPRRGVMILALLLLASVIVTHHVTSYFMASALVGLYLMSRLRVPIVRFGERIAARVPKAFVRRMPATVWKRPSERTIGPRPWAILAGSATGGALLWLLFFGREVFPYLGPHLQAATRGFVGMFTRTSAARVPFASADLYATRVPVWEQLIAFASVILITAIIPFGVLQIWRRFREHPTALLFALASLSYPFTLLLRLARGGGEIAARSWDFLFVAIGFVLAAAIAELWMARGRVLLRAAIFAVYAGMLYMGALVVGMPEWARLPGPYMFGGDTRGLQAQGFALAEWARETLGPDNRVIADSTNKLLLGSHGEQYFVDGMSWVYISPYLRREEELADAIRRGVQYIVVDWRATEYLPRLGSYFDGGEPGRPHRAPLAREKVLKFEQEDCLDRMYDGGDIIVYAIGPECKVVEEGTP